MRLGMVLPRKVVPVFLASPCKGLGFRAFGLGRRVDILGRCG
jgi:hypothetical protein